VSAFQASKRPIAAACPARFEYRRAGRALHAEIAGPQRGKERVIAFDYELCTPEPKRP
jgi:hypothetical protein